MAPSGSNVKDHFKYIVESDQTLKLHLTTKASVPRRKDDHLNK